MTQKKEDLIEVVPGDIKVGDEVVLISNGFNLPSALNEKSLKAVVIGSLGNNSDSAKILGIKTKSEWNGGHTFDDATLRCVGEFDHQLANEYSQRIWYIYSSDIKVIRRNGKRVAAPKPVKLVLSTRLKKVIESNTDSCNICKALSGFGIDNLVTQSRNYIQGDSDGYLTSVPYAMATTPNSYWVDCSQRGASSPWAVLKPILEINGISGIAEDDIANFSNKITSSFFSGLEFVERSDVSEVYSMERVNSGSLGDSCMNDDVDYLRLYDASNNISVLTLINDKGKLCGRALIWDVETEEHGQIRFLDRFYTAKFWMAENFIAYAKENNLWYKQNWDSYEDRADWINPATEKVETIKVIVNVPELHFTDEFPYIDTFCYGATDDRQILANYLPTTWEYYDTYKQTDGCRDYGNINYSYRKAQQALVEPAVEPERTNGIAATRRAAWGADSQAILADLEGEIEAANEITVIRQTMEGEPTRVIYPQQAEFYSYYFDVPF